MNEQIVSWLIQNQSIIRIRSPGTCELSGSQVIMERVRGKEISVLEQQCPSENNKAQFVLFRQQHNLHPHPYQYDY